ncbi:N-acetyl-alpha-D-glucosaminyl L-malate synthase BshA [Alicyclobacillus sp. TC]|uniref:N-acetyl-alpha-D-glucosaminyl L-malate synthase BshA n=1 Tax=Alicyclobacillus tolerans TaxID=90970 RepID=A0A1M6MNQ1_9BACL|nr:MULTISPECIES: N-acetyl-alpha-D-glucosaminyl L-malate synthase BshA [Alicyclobacillus]QRF23380.1 N-acetyl-alpha-D-glucosaminyl L-malate synthase BshA [Alicyclobacillus sp. TC]SHJ85064.1 N-acetyl-alpha-D-glucosaminyl L-malate synthase BshA [Alicyclobacillus montanus]
MRIGISCYATVGGSGAVATELGKALATRGHEVHFIVSDVPFRLGEFRNNLYIHEVETVSYPVLRTPPYDFSLAAKMADVVAEYHLDILHAHYALPFAVCAFLAKEMLGENKVRTVTTLHGTDVTVLAQDRSLKNVMRLGIERSDAVTAVSHSLIEETRSLFGTEKEIECIYNFVDPDIFRPQSERQTRACLARPGERVLMHVSNFRKIKRVPDVILVFQKVLQQVDSRLILVGEGPELTAARDLVRQLGLQEKVNFLGKQDEVASLFAAADVFLLPSEKESFGLVALESMACGVPVVGSIAGGIPEVVKPNETGFLFPIGDVDGMANAVLRLFSDENLYHRLSVGARKTAETQFNVAEQVAHYERIYQRLIEDASR